MSHAQRLICPADQLQEGGVGVRFELRPGVPAFAIRFDGTAHAYINSCPHAFTELDWQPGVFFDAAGLHLVCATHGAVFAPETGYCVGGPCRGAALVKLPVREQNGELWLEASS
jgi:nitrite reductase/ring-hydroxylating ferredoxin subunit